MKTFYNDNEPYVAAWLRNLELAGLISHGDVSEESIRRIDGWELTEYDRCHFFAGIGGWDHALQLAGWPKDRPVWTGSCPCQPFSVAGQRKGVNDDRHLWPEFYRLIGECRPSTIFGEQVASADGRKWLAGVFADLEKLGYAAAGADLCAAGVGAPHIRQRLYWVAYTKRDTGRTGRIADERSSSSSSTTTQSAGASDELGRCGELSGLGDTEQRGLSRFDGRRTRGESSDASIGLADTEHDGGRADEPQREEKERAADGWVSFEYIQCADGKARRIESGTFPLAHGVPARVGKLRAYGNAIVPQVAAEFIKAALDVLGIS